MPVVKGFARAFLGRRGPWTGLTAVSPSSCPLGSPPPPMLYSAVPDPQVERSAELTPIAATTARAANVPSSVADTLST